VIDGTGPGQRERLRPALDHRDAPPVIPEQQREHLTDGSATDDNDVVVV
jgi:hypothetical protein